MKLEAMDRRTETRQPFKKGAGKRLPHERDETPDGQEITPRSIMQQAASDLEQGLVDTDLHGERGVEKVAPKEPGQARPQAGAQQASGQPRR